MNCFDGIEWVSFNRFPECRAVVDKYFRDYFVLDYNDRGALQLRLDHDPPVELNAPVAWFTYPGPRFYFGAHPGQCWDHRYISFRGPRVKQWIESGLLNFLTRRPVITINDPERFAGQLDAVMEYLASPVYGPERAIHLFEGVLLQLHEQHAFIPPGSPAENKVAGFIRDIEQRPEAPWDFRRRARELGLSYPHFRLLFRKLAGAPPHRHLTRRRLEKAARLLRGNHLAIKQIAVQSGYADIFHFSKLFKRHFRMPPGRFRARSALS